jgi:hypothetical protein
LTKKCWKTPIQPQSNSTKVNHHSRGLYKKNNPTTNPIGAFTKIGGKHQYNLKATQLRLITPVGAFTKKSSNQHPHRGLYKENAGKHQYNFKATQLRLTTNVRAFTKKIIQPPQKIQPLNNLN